ncbi:hypothetical protein [Hymenobacter terrenus]|uniref:hypothetical protein n=1 Tax=Hymenobacter terrenus TaxID=1629124 RepID=UPI000619FFE5|nr:hypothetical protein [Hymenobacter terrenus]
MRIIRLFLFAGSFAATLAARPATAQPAPTPADTSAAPKVYYSLFWGLFRSQDEHVRPIKAGLVRPAKVRRPHQRLGQAHSGYETHSILGGAVQWTEKKMSPNYSATLFSFFQCLCEILS